ncbi:hypothetical protein ACSBR2_025433 [Camellia fascicularis]
MEVELISKEIIKPSSSTPPHLRTLRLSLLDQNAGLSYTPVILYYPKRDANFNVDEKLINQLKDSLSETLALFYLLAGRVEDRLTIDCNNEGILFSIARELLTAQSPNLQSLGYLLPYYVYHNPSDSVPYPSRTEVITAFIWKHAMAASTSVWGVQQPSILSQQMDLRRQILVTPSSKYSIGNCLWKVVAHYDAVTKEEETVSLNGLVGLLRDAVEKTKVDILPKLQQGDGKGYIGATVDSRNKNFGFLIEVGLDEKIEAWLTIDEHEMEVLEHDQEFLEFASLNPPVINPKELVWWSRPGTRGSAPSIISCSNPLISKQLHGVSPKPRL